MSFSLTFSTEAKGQLHDLEHDDDKTDLVKLKRVRACLGKLQVKPHHTSLNSHKYNESHGEKGEDIWESYIENKTPAAWRVFWHYGPQKNQITVVAITPYP